MPNRPALRKRRRSWAGMGLAPRRAIHLSTSFHVYRPEAIVVGSAGSFFLSIRTKEFFMVRFEILDGVRQCRLKIINV
jgi:hypothetical protein